MITGIYMILNKATNKFYIGSALDVQSRWRQHRHYLRRGNHQNVHLQRAWSKYSEAKFLLRVIQICSKDSLIDNEQAWLNWTQCFNLEVGYNLTPTAGNSLGVKHSQETRSRMSAAKLKMTDETKLKMKMAATGKILTAEHKAKISAGLKNRICSQETKDRISRANKGRKLSEETKIKIGLGNNNLGKKRGSYIKIYIPPIMMY